MRGSTVLICLTAIAIVAGVLGYVEYVRRDGMRRDRLSALSILEAQAEDTVKSDRTRLQYSVRHISDDRGPGQSPDDRAAIAREVADNLEKAVDDFVKMGTLRSDLAEIQGQKLAAPSAADVASFRASLFDETPGLEKLIKR